MNSFYPPDIILGITAASPKKIFINILMEITNSIFLCWHIISNIAFINVESDPKISINNQSIQAAKSKYKINNEEKNILLGIGGSGPTKRIPAIIFIKLMHLNNSKV